MKNCLKILWDGLQLDKTLGFAISYNLFLRPVFFKIHENQTFRRTILKRLDFRSQYIIWEKL